MHPGIHFLTLAGTNRVGLGCALCLRISAHRQFSLGCHWLPICQFSLGCHWLLIRCLSLKVGGGVPEPTRRAVRTGEACRHNMSSRLAAAHGPHVCMCCGVACSAVFDWQLGGCVPCLLVLAHSDLLWLAPTD